MYRAKLSQLFTLFFNEIGIRNSWIWRLNVCEKSESHEKAANVLFCWQRWWFLEEGGSCSQTEEGLLKTWNWRTIVRKSISLNLWVRTRTKCYSICLTRWTICFMFCNSLTLFLKGCVFTWWEVLGHVIKFKQLSRTVDCFLVHREKPFYPKAYVWNV